MQEIAPGLNGSLEHEEVDDEEEQHQDDSIEDDEPLRHGMDEHEQNNSFHNGSAKDVLIEDSDVKDSPNASAGKSSSSGLVACGPSSSLRTSFTLSADVAAREFIVVWIPSFCLYKGPFYWLLAIDNSTPNILPFRLIEEKSSLAACHGTHPQARSFPFFSLICDLCGPVFLFTSLFPHYQIPFRFSVYANASHRVSCIARKRTAFFLPRVLVCLQSRGGL